MTWFYEERKRQNYKRLSFKKHTYIYSVDARPIWHPVARFNYFICLATLLNYVMHMVHLCHFLCALSNNFFFWLQEKRIHKIRPLIMRKKVVHFIAGKHIEIRRWAVWKKKSRNSWVSGEEKTVNFIRWSHENTYKFRQSLVGKNMEIKKKSRNSSIGCRKKTLEKFDCQLCKKRKKLVSFANWS